MLKKLYFTFLFLLSTFLVNSQVVINEYSASNFDSHLDNYGEYEDWVELYNTTNSDIDLNGWSLTDKPFKSISEFVVL